MNPVETCPVTGAAAETQVKCSWRRSKSTVPFGEGPGVGPPEGVLFGVAPGGEERPAGGKRARRRAWRLEAHRWETACAPATAGAG